MKTGEDDDVSIMLPEDWAAMGFVSLTTPSRSQEEREMALRVLEDLRRGGIRCELVKVGEGVEVWREREGMKFDERTQRRRGL